MAFSQENGMGSDEVQQEGIVELYDTDACRKGRREIKQEMSSVEKTRGERYA